MSTSESPRKVRYAVVGLGHIAEVTVLPAFAHGIYCINEQAGENRASAKNEKTFDETNQIPPLGGKAVACASRKRGAIV